MLATFAKEEPKVDPTALFKLSYGLFILSTKDGDKQNGCLINTAFQVAEHPDRILISCQKNNLTRETLEKTGEFNISVLTEDVPFEVAGYFGFRSGRNFDKFADFKDYALASNGINYISKYTNAFLSGKVISSTDLGSHVLFIAEITESKVLSSTPSCTYAHYHKAIKPKR